MTFTQLIVQLVVALLTITMSGVAAAVVTYKLNARREERHFRRQKLEQFQMAFSGYCMLLSTHFVTYGDVMLQRISYNKALDMDIERGKDERRSYETVWMLLTIYFPAFQTVFDKLLECRTNLNRIRAEFRRSYAAGNPDGTPWLESFQQHICSIGDIEDEMKALVRGEAKRLP